MATANQDFQHLRVMIAAVCMVLLVAANASVAKGQDALKESSDQAVSKKLIDDVATQIETFCKARKLATLQVVDFRGTVGNRESNDVKREWLDSLKERGIGMRDVDSTRISGRIETQQSGDSSIIMLKCTLTDNRGAEIRTFRVRKVIATKPLS